MKQELFDLCKQFRKSLEMMDISEFPNSTFFRNFPRGCCVDTSNLLAKYLSEHGIKTEHYWGINTSGQSHAWLETMDWIIDITADQFEQIEDTVMITNNRSWHSQFKNQKSTNADFETFNTYNKERLFAIYKNIQKQLTK